MNHHLLSAFQWDDDEVEGEGKDSGPASEGTRHEAAAGDAAADRQLVGGQDDDDDGERSSSHDGDDEQKGDEDRKEDAPEAHHKDRDEEEEELERRRIVGAVDRGDHDSLTPHIQQKKPQAEGDDGDDKGVKRRKLLKMVASGYPSFHLLLSANYDNSDDETPLHDNVPVRPRDRDGCVRALPPPTATTSFAPPPPPLRRRRRRPVYIDLDEELGLKPKKRRSERHSSRRSSSSRREDREAEDPSAAVAAAPTPVLSAADQGYYEGVVDVSLPEDEHHLSELHCWTRRQLEYFSASDGDVKVLQSGRRTQLVPGRVGLRCKHCWRMAVKDASFSFSRDALMSSSSHPPPAVTATGAVSYPNNLGGIYAACAQKPTLHFDQHCPGLPPDERQNLQTLLAQHQSLSSSSSSRGGGPGRRAASQRGGGGTSNTADGGSSIGVISTTTYYVIAAKRLGIVEAGGSGGDGLRFSRDLVLDPLPLETMLRLEEASASASATLADAVSTPTGADTSLAVGGTTTLSSARSAASSTGGEVNDAQPAAVPSAVQPLEPRIAADEESEQVLAEAVMEPDDPNRYPGRVHDKARVTDFFFLTLRQMAITNAIPMDFAGKGKKTKLMRVGFAGFCCRHCYDPNILGSGGCRSFASAADNLSSSISNSFVSHLQKCQHVPVRIKRALAAYKRLHQRQLAQIPYGSQRRLIHDIWARLRACDVPEEEMMERINAMAPPPPPSDEGLGTLPAAVANSIPTARMRPSPQNSTLDIPQSRPESFPECQDVGTQQVLRRATDDWDPDENDSLMLPSERYLVSDYLFLTMRQLKVAYADSVGGGRRNSAGTAGLQCMHCMNKDNRMHLGMPSGKTFPSAPDNFASSMNTSLYGHMQACAFVPADVKTALYNVRKIHSNQCSNLKFGSQRRFFNILFDRLRERSRVSSSVSPAGGQEVDVDGTRGDGANRRDSASLVPSPLICSELGFAELTGTTNQGQRLWVCIACRMVPTALRSSGSFFTENSPKIKDRMREHRASCASDSFDLSLVAGHLEEFFRDEQPQLSRRHVLQSESYCAFVSACVGGDPNLLQLFLDCVGEVVSPTGDCEDDIGSRGKSEVLLRSKGLWAAFPVEVDSENVLKQFQCFALAHGLSGDLHSHPSLLKFVLVISPGLALPLPRPATLANDVKESHD